MIRLHAALFLALAVGAATAQERPEAFRIGDDAYYAGGGVTVDAAGLDDVFAAGERVDLAAPIAGSAHLAGRRVSTAARVAGDLYAMGADVAVTAPVAGDATLAGYDVTVSAAVGADLRAAGQNVRVTAPVTGTALLAGGSVTVDAAIGGDVVLAADDVDFGPQARIGGRLTLHGTAAVPEHVAPPDRVTRRAGPGAAQRSADRRPTWLAFGRSFLVGALVLAALTALLALVAPAGAERLADVARNRPLRAFGMGFLALATLVGAAVLLAMTLIGIVVAPAVLVAAAALCLLGYLYAVYFAGRAIWDWADQLPPDTFAERALVALVGALAVSLIALVPYVGWLAVSALALVGLGALTIAALRPEFGG